MMDLTTDLFYPTRKKNLASSSTLFFALIDKIEQQEQVLRVAFAYQGRFRLIFQLKKRDHYSPDLFFKTFPTSPLITIVLLFGC
jgi:hypothetical protein